MTTAYLTVAEGREFARNELATDELLIESVITAASAAVDQWCGRSDGFTLPTSATPRTFVPQFGASLLQVDDIANTTGLIVSNDGSTLAASDYQLEVVPGNTRQNINGVSHPYGWVRLLDGDWWSFDAGRATVTITARWGWPTATPDSVKLATRLLVRDYLGARDAQFGFATFGVDGFTRRIGKNPVVMDLLSPYRRFDRTVGIA